MVGGGFRGLQVVKGLKDVDVSVTLIDRRNHHLFQPLLYQVSTALLAPGDIAPALRTVLAGQQNTSVVLGDVTSVSANGKEVTFDAFDGSTHTLECDYLVIAAGAQPNYFGNEHWARFAPPMKTISDAINIRERILRAFELADSASDDDTRRRHLTFVVVGAGPTGVEVAGQLAALARRTLRREFHHLNWSELRIMLLDGGDLVLGQFSPPLQDHARRKLTGLGVDVRLRHLATNVDDNGISLERVGSSEEKPPEQTRIDASTVIWAAGVSPVGLAASVAKSVGAEVDEQGRIKVTGRCSIPGHSQVFVIGDIADVQDLPCLAEPAMQAGRFVAGEIRNQLHGRRHFTAFRYRDLGSMATISPTDALTQIGPLRLTGVLGKVAWAAVHIVFLVGWGNRAGGRAGLTDGYIDSERSAVIEFARYLGEPVWTATGDDADRYLTWLRRDRGLARSTVESKATAVARFFEFTIARYQGDIHALTGVVVAQPIDEFNRPASTWTRAVRVPPSDDDVDHLFAAWGDALPDQRKYLTAARDYMAASLWRRVGLRLNETVMLDLRDWRPDLGEYGKLHVRYGKGSRGRGPKEQ